MNFVPSARPSASAASASMTGRHVKRKYAQQARKAPKTRSLSAVADWRITTGKVANKSAPNIAWRADSPIRREIPATATIVASSAASWTKPANRSVLPRIILNDAAISAFGREAVQPRVVGARDVGDRVLLLPERRTGEVVPEGVVVVRRRADDQARPRSRTPPRTATARIATSGSRSASRQAASAGRNGGGEGLRSAIHTPAAASVTTASTASSHVWVRSCPGESSSSITTTSVNATR